MGLREVEFTHNLADTIGVMQRHGLLLASVGADGRPNVMTIGWGNAGVIWRKPIFVVLVRPSRFTFGNIEATGEFVVNVPTDEMHDACAHCGTVSGRDHDKFKDCKFTLAEAARVKAPLIEQCAMHYECRVVHRNDVADSQLDAAVRRECYPKGDLHRVYYGEILRTVARV